MSQLQVAKEKLNSWPWSYSRVNAYETCPRMFKYTYLDDKPKINNSFAEFGTFCHHLLEQYFKGEVEFFELCDMYVTQYDGAVKLEFPPNKYVDLAESYYEQGLEFFRTFEGLNRKFSVVGVEEKVSCDIGGHAFSGYIDLVLRNDKGDLTIIDHKSKKRFASKAEEAKYRRQLYLYAGALHEIYGDFPAKLSFNMIRANQIVQYPFKQDEYEEAVSWFTGTIDKIFQDNRFKARHNQFFCDHICSVREHCPLSAAYKDSEVVDCSLKKKRSRKPKKSSESKAQK